MNLEESVKKNTQIIRSMKAAIDLCDKPGLIVHGGFGSGKVYLLLQTLKLMERFPRFLYLEQGMSGYPDPNDFRKLEWINPLVLEDGDNIHTYVVDDVGRIEKDSQHDKELDIAFRHLFILKPIILITYDLSKVPLHIREQSNTFEVLK